MRRTSTLLASAAPALLIALSACGGGGVGPGALEDACNQQEGMSPELCACLEESAQETLSDEAYAFAVATMAGDEAEAQRLGEELGREESSEAALFLMSGVQRCAIDLPQSPPVEETE